MLPFLILWLLIIELLTTGLLNSISKVILAIVILVLSGLTIPTIFFTTYSKWRFQYSTVRSCNKSIVRTYFKQLHFRTAP